MMVLLKEKRVCKKKIARCVWCGELIFPGQIAIERAYTMGNEFNHDYLHTECMEAMHTMDWNGEDEFTPGEFLRGSCDPR
jgi:hypothetical protein